MYQSYLLAQQVATTMFLKTRHQQTIVGKRIRTRCCALSKEPPTTHHRPRVSLHLPPGVPIMRRPLAHLERCGLRMVFPGRYNRRGHRLLLVEVCFETLHIGPANRLGGLGRRSSGGPLSTEFGVSHLGSLRWWRGWHGPSKNWDLHGLRRFPKIAECGSFRPHLLGQPARVECIARITVHDFGTAGPPRSMALATAFLGHREGKCVDPGLPRRVGIGLTLGWVLTVLPSHLHPGRHVYDGKVG